MTVWGLFDKALMITAFVAAMMLVIEYVNVQTRGVWIKALGRGRVRPLVVAALLGAIPGCLGAFVVVALYAHRRLTLGAVVAAMIATSGDETFVMLALFPGVAIVLTAALVVIGVLAGLLIDRLVGRRRHAKTDCDPGLDLHAEELERCACYPGRSGVVALWRPPSPYRATLTVVIVLFTLGLIAGQIGPQAWGWKRVTFLVISVFSVFVVVTVPDHFLDDHLWRHVMRTHVPRIFLWTFAALALMAALDASFDLASLVRENRWTVLVVASLVGIIPESGPHLVFITMFEAGTVPLSVLFASSAIQDGHGMLPLLAESRRDFLKVKGINLAVGLLVGAALMAFGL